MNHPLLRHAKRSLAALAIASALTPGLACSQTLEQAVANTLDTNPAIRQAFNQFKAREEQVNQAQAGYLPTIDLTAGIGREEVDNPVSRAKGGTTSLNRGEAGVSIKQVLFDGFRTANEVDRFSREASSEQWKLYGTAENKALDAVKVYLNYLRAKQVVVLSEKNLKSHEETYDQIKQKTEYGLGSTADLSQVTGRLARARANLISAKNNLLDTESQFFRVVNQAPKDLIKPMPDTSMLPKDLKAALEEAKANQPALHSAMNDIEAARFERKSAKSNYYPEVSVELNGGWNNNLGGTEGYANDLQAMVRMRYNLFNGGSDSAREREASYKLGQAQEIEQNTFREVVEGTTLAWNASESLLQQMKFLKEHVIAAKQTLEAYDQQFRIGQRTLLDVLDAENELFNARKDYINAEYDHLIAQYRILNATGSLLSSLRVTAPDIWQGEDQYEGGITR